MGSPSKEDNIVELFYNYPTKHWHFKDITNAANISERGASHWLKILTKEKIIRHNKTKGKMPYFMANHNHTNYYNKKKIYALNQMFNTGLLTSLESLKKAKVIIIFGSFARGDWTKESDIDIFILGDAKDFKYGKIWKGLERQLSIHSFKTKKNIKDIRSGLINNVVEGYFVKGSIHDLVKVSA